MNEILIEIKSILINKYGLKDSQIHPESKLLDLIDSVDRLYLLLDLKKRYSANLTSEELVAIITISDLASILEKIKGNIDNEN